MAITKITEHQNGDSLMCALKPTCLKYSHQLLHHSVLSPVCGKPTIKPVSLTATLVLMETSADQEKCETRTNFGGK